MNTHKEMSYVTRWIFSTSHKDIGILYLLFGMISAMVATGMSVIIRMELANGNSQFFHGNNHAFNVIVTGHAIAMIFLFVMPVLIGAFGNFLLPIMIGGVDMAFARLNNISFWCLPPALVCIIASLLIENGAGTGWTVNMLLLKISFDAWRSLSTLQGLASLWELYIIYIWYLIEYSFINFSSVKSSIIIGKYACIYFINPKGWALLKKEGKYILQRLNMIIYNSVVYKVNSGAFISKKHLSNGKSINKHYNKDNKFDFNQWLVGFTDGDGCFNVYINKELTKVNFTFKISQNKYNGQVLHYIKKNLSVGKVVQYDDNMMSYILRDKKYIENILFPIFDNNYLLTSKYYNYIIFKECLLISNNKDLSQKDKILLIKSIKDKERPDNYISPVWNQVGQNGDIISYKDITSVNQINHIITKSWLIGFIEAEGSFYLVNKTTNRIVHAFGITQKLDPIILYSIKYLLHINSNVRYKSKYYILDTTNSRNIEYIINYFILNNHKNLFKGMKSFEFNLWKRTYYKYKNNYDKLNKIRNIIRFLTR